MSTRTCAWPLIRAVSACVVCVCACAFARIFLQDKEWEKKKTAPPHTHTHTFSRNVEAWEEEHWATLTQTPSLRHSWGTQHRQTQCVKKERWHERIERMETSTRSCREDIKNTRAAHPLAELQQRKCSMALSAGLTLGWWTANTSRWLTSLFFNFRSNFPPHSPPLSNRSLLQAAILPPNSTGVFLLPFKGLSPVARQSDMLV